MTRLCFCAPLLLEQAKGADLRKKLNKQRRVLTVGIGLKAPVLNPNG
jgi:hypothetical protein